MASRESSAAGNRVAKSLKSGGSRASINVTVPTTIGDDAREPVQVRGLSPGRHAPDRPVSQEVGTLTSPQGQNSKVGSDRISRNFSPRSSGTVPPQGTPTRKAGLSDQELEQHYAVQVIERAWLGYRDRQMFKLLKHAICAAEQSMSYEILRKVSPKEAELLKDKSMQIKVRFRFGGTEFPPMIFFKIYTSVGKGLGIKYVSGKRMIQPASEAARDACDLMGHRKFYDQMIQDAIQQETHKITDENDVTTLKDYMQYLSLLDETPSYMGGRDNGWRKLTLEVLPRNNIFYDVVDFLYNHRMSAQLVEELPTLLSRPFSQEVQLEHIRIISQLRPRSPVAPYPTPKSKLSMASRSQVSSRRSKQARSKALRMKKLYEGDIVKEPTIINEASEKEKTQSDVQQNVKFNPDPAIEEWEVEADKLYEWTQELSFDELVATPRLGTAQTGMTY